MKRYGYVYLVTCQASGKYYVGQTTKTVVERWAAHVRAARCGRNNRLLHKAIRKYGPEAFTVKSIMYANDQKELNYLEDLVIEAFMSVTRLSGYNLTTGGDSGGKLSAETKAKMSAALKGKKKPPRSSEHRAKLGLANKGKTPSVVTRTKISAAHRHKKLSPESIEKRSAARRVLTDEQAAAIGSHLVLGKRGTKGSGNCQELAGKYGVSKPTILAAARRYKEEQERLNGRSEEIPSP
jgi:group I intron endonuclease